MNVFGTIYDSFNEAPLPGASIVAADNNGNVLPVPGAETDANGFFNYTSTALDQGAQLLIAAPGYVPVLMLGSSFRSPGQLALDRSSNAGTATAAGKISPGVLIGGGVIAALLIFSKKKRKGRIGSPGSAGPQIPWGTVIIGGGVVIGGYLLIKNGAGALANFFKTSTAQTNEQTAQTTTDANKATTDMLDKTGQNKITLTDDQLAAIANTIYTQGTQLYPDAGAAINQQLMQVNNLADLNKVIGYFGTKPTNVSLSYWSACNLLGWDCSALNLSQFVNVVSTQPFISSINEYFYQQGIDFQF